MADYLGLEDASGHLLLEDGTSGLLLETSGVTAKIGAATVGLVGSGVSQKTSLITSTKAGYATVGTVGRGGALIGSEFLSPALPHELVLAPESADSFSLIPSVPGSFALTPLDEEDFVLDSHPHLDSG